MKNIRRVLSITLSMLILISTFTVFSGAAPKSENLKSSSVEWIDSSSKFNDVNSSGWYKQYVDYVATYGLMNGMTPNTFGPGLNLNRAMFVQILANLSDVDTTDINVNTPFSDVPAGKWYTAAVNWAAKNDIVNGTTPNTFSPKDDIQRQQMCVMIVRFAQFKGIEFKNIIGNKFFKDHDKIQDYAKDAVYICRSAGIVDGMTEDTFAPRDSATRAQIAAILYRFCENTGFLDASSSPDNPPDDSIEPEYPNIEFSKYNFDENPLINPDRKQNMSVLPSFDMNSTGFVRTGTKLSNLKGKTLTFYTGDNYPVWSYRNANGQIVDEWSWFGKLKSELGLNIKYTVMQHQKAIDAALVDMNAGNSCDLIYTNHVAYPSSLCISRPLENFVNMNRLEASPGVCSKVMELTKWGGTHRTISPIGNVDVLWYNQTLSRELGLSDPHKLWEQGKWNWNSFRDYLVSAPYKDNNDQIITAFVQWTKNASYTWPSTNGVQYICIDTDAQRPCIINNWTNPKTYEAWEFITDVCNNINYSTSASKHLDLYNGNTLMSSTMYTHIYRDTEYSKHARINWVPYPKAPGESGTEVCQWKGNAMMLPKKTVNNNNIYIALKFMELWANRFTESIFDNFNGFEYYNFNYSQRKQYFDFVTNNMVFALAMNDYIGTDIRNETKFFECFDGYDSYDVKVEADKAAKLLNNYIVECMKYGL